MQEILLLWPYVIVAILGVVIHLVSKWAELEKTTGKKVNVTKWLSKHKWRTILAFCLAIGGIILLDFGGAINFPAALMMGYTGDSLMKKGAKEDS